MRLKLTHEETAGDTEFDVFIIFHSSLWAVTTGVGTYLVDFIQTSPVSRCWLFVDMFQA